MKYLGIVFIVIGLVMVSITGFNIVTKKKVVDLGPVEINKEEKTPVSWSPIFGGGLFIAGILIVVLNRKSNL